MPVGNVLVWRIPTPAKPQSAMTGLIGLTMPVGNVRGGGPVPTPAKSQGSMVGLIR